MLSLRGTPQVDEKHGLSLNGQNDTSVKTDELGTRINDADGDVDDTIRDKYHSKLVMYGSTQTHSIGIKVSGALWRGHRRCPRADWPTPLECLSYPGRKDIGSQMEVVADFQEGPLRPYWRDGPQGVGGGREEGPDSVHAEWDLSRLRIEREIGLLRLRSYLSRSWDDWDDQYRNGRQVVGDRESL
jgi:hypothetical protein